MKLLLCIIFMMFSDLAFSENASIGSPEIYPEHPTSSDNVIYLCDREVFGANCTYAQRLDSIVGNIFYVSGEYDMEVNCPISSELYELPLGKLPVGDYHIKHLVREVNGIVTDTAFQLKFSVSKSINQFVDRYMGFMLYENDECSYYALYGKGTIDGIDYIKEDNGRYCYRQEGNKVYCYSLAEQKEYLVMDFGLKVGDVFTLYDGCNVVVEQQADTLLTCWNAQKTCKKLHLRGVEQPDFTDVWIEGVGSLRYGINPPKAEETYLLHSSMSMEECEEYCDYCTFVFEPQKDDLRATMVALGEEIHEDAFPDYNEYMEAHKNKLLTLDLRDDTLHIGGYIGTYCEQALYLLIEEGVGTIYIMSVPFPLDPEADCLSVNAIDLRIPGFAQESYIVNFWGRTYQISRNETSLTTLEQESEVVPYHDLQGRPVANSTRGIYIKDGKKMVVK